MIILNLVPDTLKNEHIKKHVNRVIRNNLFLLFIVATLITILILLGRIYLENKFIESVIETTQTSGRLQSPISQDVNVSNETLKAAKKIQDEFIPWQNLLITLSTITPDKVVINQFQVTQEQNVLRLLGRAQDRESFLLFKENLESDELFADVLSPIENILNKTNINFSLNITVNTDIIQ